MTAPIGPGDYVECVDQSATQIRYGNIYRVSDIGEGGGCRDCDCTTWVDLEGVPAIAESAWCSGCQVRPIYRPKRGAFDYLLQPTDEKVPA